MSGCDRELNAHFYSAASLWYQIPHTFTRYHLQSHYTDTGATSPSPTPKIRVPSGEQLVPLLTTLVCHGPGSNLVPPDLGADTLPTELPRPVYSVLCSFKDYFSSYGVGQSVGGAHTGEPRETPPGTPASRTYCSLSQICPMWGSNPNQTQR